AVAQSESALTPILTRPGFNQIVADALVASRDHSADSEQLTAREHEIVRLIAEGLSNKKIAGVLHIASFMVKSHVHNILEKLTSSTRLQIAAYIRKKNS